MNRTVLGHHHVVPVIRAAKALRGPAVTRPVPGLRFVSAETGRWFAPAGTTVPLRGVHGGSSTRTQVAVVAGGHPAVSAIAGSLADRPPDAHDWAVTLADLLEIEVAGATGRSLVA